MKFRRLSRDDGYIVGIRHGWDRYLSGRSPAHADHLLHVGHDPIPDTAVEVGGIEAVHTDDYARLPWECICTTVKR